MVRNKEVWFRRKDGSTFPVLISANNLYDNDGNLIGSNSAIIDESDTYKARKALEKANEQLKEAHRLKDEFISIASHELRTPIQPILNYVELSEKGLIEPKNALKIIRDQARRLTKLANDILDVSRIETGNLSYNMQKLMINDILTEVVNTCKYVQFKSSKIARRISIETKLTNDVELYLDKMRISQALTNVLQNSIKFTGEGKIMVETFILAEKGLFEIRISDTGIGISKEILPKLFGKFVTKTAGDDDLNKHGTGLGLFITKSIIQAHRGDIFAQNNESGKGATFVITLPLK